MGTYTPGSGGGVNIRRASGTWLCPVGPNGSTTYSPPVNNLILTPWIADSTFTTQQVQFDVTAVATAGDYDIGIYTDSGAGVPGVKLAETGSFPVATAQLYTPAINFSFVQGTIYWIGGCILDGAITLRGVNQNYQPPFAPRILTAPGSGAYGSALSQGGISTAPLPANFTNVPSLTFQVARLIWQVA